MSRPLVYFIESPTELHSHVFQWLLFLLGVEGEEAREASDPRIVLYYGRDVPADAKVPLVIRRDAGLVVGDAPDENAVETSPKGVITPFDLIETLGALFSDRVNIGRDGCALDEHQRLRFDSSFRSDLQLTAIPLANACVRHLAGLLERFCGITPLPLWPRGKTCAIALSHDVDDPDKYAPLRAPLYASAKSPAFNARQFAGRLKAWTRYLRDEDRNNFWLFDSVMDAEAEHGFRSTFFFASLNRRESGSSILDVPYALERPEYRPVFDRMRRDGFGIGLHASYNAHEAAERFESERLKLERAAETRVRGLRHHYWHLGPHPTRTLAFHEAAGFEYDSSYGFNDHMGFRHHTALPWFPWNPETGRPIRVLQLPPFCMDGNLFYRPIEVDAAIEQIVTGIQQIKACGGFGSIDWHVRTSFPGNPEFRNWGECYVRLLERLAREPDIWVTSLEDIHEWLMHGRKESALSGPTTP